MPRFGLGPLALSLFSLKLYDGLLILGCLEIAKSRASAWNVVTFRKHTVDKVYAGSPDGADLVLTGTLESRTKGSGSATIVTEFAGRAEDQALPGVDWAVLCSESIMMDA